MATKTLDEILEEIDENNLAAEIKTAIIAQESGIRNQESGIRNQESGISYKFAIVDFNKDIFGVLSLELARKYRITLTSANNTALKKYFHSDKVFFIHYQYKTGSMPYAFFIRGGQLNSMASVSTNAPYGVAVGYNRYGARFQPFLYIAKTK